MKEVWTKGLPGEKVIMAHMYSDQHITLSLDGTPGAFRIWLDESDYGNGQPLLVPGQTATNGMPFTFAGSSPVVVWLEVLAPGSAQITYAFEGFGPAKGLSHSDTLKVTAHEHKILFKAADGTVTNALQVAKWEKTLTRFFVNEVKFEYADFINKDEDRFQVFLNDHRRTEATLDITLTQVGSISGNRTVTLYRQTDGTYLSTNLLLVADVEDRDNMVLTAMGAPDGINQRMFTVALDDTLSVSYTHNGIALTNAATVGVDVKELTVYFVVMTTNGIPCVTDQDRVNRDMKITRSCYAQANIRVNTVRLPDFPAPSALGPTFTNWTVRIAEHQYVLTQEAKNIFDAAGSTSQNICFVYVPWIHPYPVDDGSVFNLSGISVMPNLYETDAANKNYLRNAFISSEIDILFTTPHEFGHGLKVEHKDAPWPWQLMTGGGVSPINTPKASKRLSKGHIETMRDDNKEVFQ